MKVFPRDLKVGDRVRGLGEVTEVRGEREIDGSPYLLALFVKPGAVGKARTRPLHRWLPVGYTVEVFETRDTLLG